MEKIPVFILISLCLKSLADGFIRQCASIDHLGSYDRHKLAPRYSCCQFFEWLCYEHKTKSNYQEILDADGKSLFPARLICRKSKNNGFTIFEDERGKKF